MLGKYIEKCRLLPSLGRRLACVGIFKQLDMSRPHQSGCLFHSPHRQAAGLVLGKVKWAESQPSGILYSFFFFAILCGMQDLSSPTRDQTWAPCSGSMEP